MNWFPGENAHYDESCSSTLASTFSNGAKNPNTGVVSYFFGLHSSAFCSHVVVLLLHLTVCARDCDVHKQRNWTANFSILFFCFVRTTFLKIRQKFKDRAHLLAWICVFRCAIMFPGTHTSLCRREFFSS